MFSKNFAQQYSGGMDSLGNWASFAEDVGGDGYELIQQRTNNAANEITDITEEQGQTAWVTPAYDKAGNMTTMPKPSSPTTQLRAKYDAWNRLVQVEQYSGGASGGSYVTLTKYEYDGLGRRVERQWASSASGGIDTYEHYYYAGEQMVETRRTTSSSAQPENVQPLYQYVWSARYVDAPILRDKNTDSDGQCDDQRLYYLTDANMNVTTLVSAAGAVLERYVYDPYGKVTIYDDDWSTIRSSSSYDNTVLYTGRDYDPTAGLYYCRARWYHPGLGNFISRDPLGYAAGDANLYRYVRSSPVNYTDASGLAPMAPVGWPSPTPPVGGTFEGPIKPSPFPAEPPCPIAPVVPPGNWKPVTGLPPIETVPPGGYKPCVNDLGWDPQSPTGASGGASDLWIGGMGNYFGLPKEFWNWYHKQYKQRGEPDIRDRNTAKEIYDYWVKQGKPDAEGHATAKPEPQPKPPVPPPAGPWWPTTFPTIWIWIIPPWYLDPCKA